MNPSLTRPNVYNRYIPAHKLLCVTRLRMVSHNLKIETGRHFKFVIPREERLCSCEEVEDEKHFVLHCCHYTHIREKYFENNLPFHIQLDSFQTPDFLHELTKCRDIYEKLQLSTISNVQLNQVKWTFKNEISHY